MVGQLIVPGFFETRLFFMYVCMWFFFTRVSRFSLLVRGSVSHSIFLSLIIVIILR